MRLVEGFWGVEIQELTSVCWPIDKPRLVLKIAAPRARCRTGFRHTPASTTENTSELHADVATHLPTIALLKIRSSTHDPQTRDFGRNDDVFRPVGLEIQAIEASTGSSACGARLHPTGSPVQHRSGGGTRVIIMQTDCADATKAEQPPSAACTSGLGGSATSTDALRWSTAAAASLFNGASAATGI